MSPSPYLFINYRQSDVKEAAGRLKDALDSALEPGQVFIDYTGIDGGDDWPAKINVALDKASLMFALIGNSWLGTRHERSQRRLIDLPGDWVRIELESALAKDSNTTLLPVLIHEGELPLQEDLPDTIQALTDKQSIQLRHKDWDTDLEKLVRLLEKHGFKRLASPKPPAPTKPSGTGIDSEIPRYQEQAASHHQFIALAGFETAVRVPINLEDLYVPLRAGIDLRSKGKAEFANANDAECELGDGDNISLVDAFRCAKKLSDRRGLVILGDPGSGKTTHLKRLLLWLVRKAPEDIGLEAGMVPVFLPLRELEDLDAGLDTFVERQLLRPHLNTEPGFGRRLLQRGRVLFLLDGLDEISKLERRAAVSKWIDDALVAHPSCRFVVTCRYAGYNDEVRLDAQFLELHIRPLVEEQVRSFVETWFSLVEGCLDLDAEQAARKARKQIDGLLETLAGKVFRARRVSELTGNPLLLTAICLVHRDRGRLPARRAELFDECVNVLLEHWRKSKELEINLGARDARRVLEPVAFWMHEEDQRTRATSAELEPVVERCLGTLKGFDGDAKSFLSTIRDQSGLLTGWSDDSFGFMHLGFQEYLAAHEILAQAFGSPDALAELAGKFGESWWREVGLLFIASGGLPVFEQYMAEIVKLPAFADCPDLVAECLDDAPQFSAKPFADLLRLKPEMNEDLWRRQLAAYHVLQREAPDLLKEFQAQLMRHPYADLRAMVETELAEQETITAERGGFELVRIQGGSFNMGSPAGEKGRRSYEGPVREVEIRDFYLGRSPVTNEEYGRFLEANPNARKPKYWNDRQYSQSSQPVVGIGWDDAQRYCTWAGLVLPSEAQWEYACRAGESSRFWSGDDDAELERVGWCKGNSNGKLHGVREKPASPFGLYDMHGNVWEWCQDTWHDSYDAAPADGSAWEDSGSGGRVMRGGSWRSPASLCRSACRLRGDPSWRSGLTGFRPARSSLGNFTSSPPSDEE